MRRLYIDTTCTLTTKDNLNYGFHIAETSSAEFKGVTIIENNVNAGILINLSSSAWVSKEGSIAVKGTTGLGMGIFINTNSTLHVEGKIISENNSGSECAGIQVQRSSNLTLQGSNLSVNIQNNSGIGIHILQQSSARFDPGIEIHDNTGDGLFIGDNSMLYAKGTGVKNNGGKGISADDGSSVKCNSSVITGNTGGDINYTFGVRSTLNQNTIGNLPITCDSSVMSRGDHICP